MESLLFRKLCKEFSLHTVFDSVMDEDWSVLYKKLSSIVAIIILLVIQINSSIVWICVIGPLIISFAVYGFGNFDEFLGHWEYVEFDDWDSLEDEKDVLSDDEELNLVIDECVQTFIDSSSSDSDASFDNIERTACIGSKESDSETLCLQSSTPSFIENTQKNFLEEYLFWCGSFYSYLEYAFPNIKFHLLDYKDNNKTDYRLIVTFVNNKIAITACDKERNITFKSSEIKLEEANKQILKLFFQETEGLEFSVSFRGISSKSFG